MLLTFLKNKLRVYTYLRTFISSKRMSRRTLVGTIQSGDEPPQRVFMTAIGDDPRKRRLDVVDDAHKHPIPSLVFNLCVACQGVLRNPVLPTQSCTISHAICMDCYIDSMRSTFELVNYSSVSKQSVDVRDKNPNDPMGSICPMKCGTVVYEQRFRAPFVGAIMNCCGQSFRDAQQYSDHVHYACKRQFTVQCISDSCNAVIKFGCDSFCGVAFRREMRIALNKHVVSGECTAVYQCQDCGPSDALYLFDELTAHMQYHRRFTDLDESAKMEIYRIARVYFADDEPDDESSSDDSDDEGNDDVFSIAE